MNRQAAYKRLFADSPDQQQIIADLAQFCRGNVSTFHADARIHALMEGRREVYLRIMQHLDLDLESLWAIYGAKE